MSSESDDTRPQTAMVRLLRQVDYRERRAKLIWSTRYRIAVISFMLLYYTLLVWMDLIPLHLAPLLVGLAGMLINSLAYLLFRIGWWREMLTYIVVLCDMAGITVLAYYSGGMASPFVLIYLLHVVATAVYGTGRMAGTMTFTMERMRVRGV